MDYRAIRPNVGFRGKYWDQGEIAKDVQPGEQIPHHFVPMGTPEPVKTEPHRTEPQPVAIGETAKVHGGMAAGLKNEKLPRILTTDVVPNDAETQPKPKKKGAGRAKKSG